MEIRLKPIGYVKNNLKQTTFHQNLDIEARKKQIRSKFETINQTISDLIIDDPFVEMLDGLEAFSHIVVIYWPHLLTEEHRSIKKVHPMGRKDLPLQGVFATRSPARPNSILISTVALLEKKHNILRVKGLEALDGSPILDIKAMVQIDDGIQDPVFPEWIHQIQRDLKE